MSHIRGVEKHRDSGDPVVGAEQPVPNQRQRIEQRTGRFGRRRVDALGRHDRPQFDARQEGRRPRRGERHQRLDRQHVRHVLQVARDFFLPLQPVGLQHVALADRFHDDQRNRFVIPERAFELVGEIDQFVVAAIDRLGCEIERQSRQQGQRNTDRRQQQPQDEARVMEQYFGKPPARTVDQGLH